MRVFKNHFHSRGQREIIFYLPLIPQVCGTGIPENKKAQARRAKHKSNHQMVWFRTDMSCMFALNIIRPIYCLL